MQTNGQVVVFGQQQQIQDDICKNLEQCFNEAKRIDANIAKTLNNDSEPSWLINIPFIKNLITKTKAIKPIPYLEKELRDALNNSLIALMKIGKKSQEEKFRIELLNKTLKKAINESWGPKKFIDFIESETDIDFSVNIDGQQINVKEIFNNLESQFSDNGKKSKSKEWIDWLKQHIKLSQQYLDGMNALCYVSSEWIEGMSRSYYDLSKIKSGMDEIQKTLNIIGKGGRASTLTQTALRQYGTAYVKGMQTLMNGYNDLINLQGEGESEFQSELLKLTNTLNRNLHRALPNTNINKNKGAKPAR